MTTRNIFNLHAMKYAELNWEIFPLAVGAKVPIARSAGLNEASVDRAQIEIWRKSYPHANIALRCGERSGVIVIDFDPRNGSVETLAKLAAEGKTFPDTVESETPRGGRHKYYAFNNRVVVSGSNKLGPGIDISTNGHYVVLPPSYWGKVDKCYRWVRPPRGTDFAPLPKWVIDALAPKSEPKRQPLERINFSKLGGYRRQALSDLDQAMRRIAGLADGRHEAPFKVGAALGAYVHHDLLSLADLENAVMSACSANGALGKYSPKDLMSQIQNGVNRARGDHLPPLAREHRHP